MARPAEPTTLGKFFTYPLDATGAVAPYWLASSPGSNHRVRMTCACKRAFLATIEAILERATAPANCGNYPPSGVDFKTVLIDETYVDSLIELDPWDSSSYRAGLGAKFSRGMPKDEWENICFFVVSLWSPSVKEIACGDVYAWQTSMLEYVTGGWVDDEGLSFDATSDLSFFMADADSALGSPVRLRLWGDFAGGSGGYPVADWITTALRALGANADYPSMTPGGYADSNLNGTPAPLAEGHAGNWFGSTSGGIIGPQNNPITLRRSSSAWAVLQSMLANMYITHLKFQYSFFVRSTIVKWTIERYVSMDENGDIVVEEVTNGVTSESGMGSSQVFECTYDDRQSGLPTIECTFYCLDEDIEGLAVSVRPQDGWSRVGSSLAQYLIFGQVTPGAAKIELSYEVAVGVDSVSAGNGHAYPAPGMRQYIGSYGGVTFVDYESLTTSGMTPDWVKWCVRAESGNVDLTVPVRSHVEWLLTQVPSFPFPSIDSCPSSLGADTSAFWGGWEVYYPDTPNVQVNGQDAYFPVRFRNITFGGDGYIPIYHDDSDRSWRSSQQYEAIFGNSQHAFPDWDDIHYGGKQFAINDTGSAMAAYSWNFKAMPKA